MAIARSRTFRSGNSETLRLPKDVAFGEDVELVIVRSGDVLTVYPLTVYPAAPTIPEMTPSTPRPPTRTASSWRTLLDRMIAAQALAHRATLVTLNPADFADVVGLRLRAW